MNSILSLIGNPSAPFGLDAALTMAATALSAHGAKLGEKRILAPAVAGEMAFGGLDAKAAGEAVRTALLREPADINILSADNRRKRLLVADMDSTIITCECLDEIADFAGLKPQVAAITERAMKGELAFEPALRARVALLKGMPEDTLEKVYAERVRLTAGARALVQTMKAHGARTVLVSGGFRFFTSLVADAAGFERDYANVLGAADGALTGTVAEPILGREAKLATLKASAAEAGLSLADALAVGDGANDLAMIEAARDAGGLGVAFHAKPVVAEAAGIRIDRGDLTALLYLQGYAASEIVAR
jgi:phosphoserine phosphatase